jgi:methionyl aminopeptidase
MRKPARKLSRNAPCWCGSGLKYKNCHMKQDMAARRERLSRPARLTRRGGQDLLIKTEEQIEGIRASCRLTREILDLLPERIAVGVLASDIDQWVHDYTIAHGAKPAPLGYRGYPYSTCTSLNEEICHGFPTERKLRDGDILNVDVTCILDGYYGDSSRMFLIGQVSDEARRLVDVTRECLYLGIDQVKPGNHVGDIGHAIQVHAEEAGFSVVREFVGHGTGVQFHEPLQIPHFGEPGQGIELLPNMTFTIEPMINAGDYPAKILKNGWTAVTRDGSLSAQWEHTMRVTEDGVEVMTAAEGEPF